MKAKFNTLIQIRFIFCGSGNTYNPLSPKTPILNPCLFSTLLNSAETLTNVKVEEFAAEYHPKDPTEVFMKWGCTENDIANIFMRSPSLRKSNPTCLEYKLNILSEIGLSSSDLIKIINCRPRFLSRCINQLFRERLDYFEALFGSKEVLRKAIVRNPSLLTYDFHNEIKPVVEIYNQIGVSKKELVPMLMSRPTLIPRTLFDDEKLEYIRKTGVSKESKMYKYVVCLLGISRLETIREKIANLEKFGFTDDEVFGLIGRTPFLLTLSIDKIQRNMTFILGTMKLPASVILTRPDLLYFNLESVLKPRVLLARKIQDMGLKLQIEGPDLFRALRMKEDRFVRAFILCNPEDVAKKLMGYYTKEKAVKRLAESCKKTLRKGFPF